MVNLIPIKKLPLDKLERAEYLFSAGGGPPGVHATGCNELARFGPNTGIG